MAVWPHQRTYNVTSVSGLQSKTREWVQHLVLPLHTQTVLQKLLDLVVHTARAELPLPVPIITTSSVYGTP